MESVCRSSDIPTDVANKLRFDVTRVLKSFHPPSDKNLTDAEWKALRGLQRRQDIVILPADKGRAVCVLSCAQYQEKVARLVDDRDTYDELSEDPTGKYTRGLRGVLKDIEREGKLDRKTYLTLYPSDPMPPLFYGLPKIHKDGAPLRPIVACIGTVSYEVAKHLAGILSRLVGASEHHVRDTYSFVEGLRELKIEDDEVMVSFDVESLFTSVPTDAACDEARKRLEAEFERADSELRASTALDVTDIVQLLELCLEMTYFRVNGKFYKQKWGTAMGSPVSVVVANLFMEALEQSALESFPHPVKYWRRYVDDTFVIIKRNLVAELLDHLNKQHAKIRFTCEVEESGSLPFLDVRVYRQDGELRTEVFRKRTHTDKYLDFTSHHSGQHKASVPLTLFKRASQCSTTKEAEEKENERIGTALAANGYPKGFVRSMKRKASNRGHGRADVREGSTQGGNENDSRRFVCIPYVQGISEQVIRALKPYVKVGTKPGPNFRNRLVKSKDKLDTTSKSGLVYQYQCECGMVYVGETGRTLKTREADHKRAIRTGNAEHSGISKHVLETGHSIDWDGVKILDRESNWTKRKIKEGYYISKVQAAQCMNVRPGWQMPDVYQVL